MKIKSIILYAVAVLFASGCSVSKGFEEESQVSFIAYTEVAPESKVALGTSSSSKPQTFWENSDVISVYTDGGVAPDGYKRTAFPFSTALETPASIARFIYTGNDFVNGNNYLAVYPHKSDARVVKLATEANEGEAYRFANFTIPTDQTLVAGSFDKNALLMVAYANELQDLHFKNAVALIKFKVADENVTSGQIYSAGSALSGTYICKALEDDMQPKLDTYGSGDKNSYVNFALADETPLTPGVEYYVAVRPDDGTNGNYLDQDNGFGIKLNGVTVKEYPSVKSFKRNTIYDLGTLSVPAVTTLTVSFDFTDAEAMSEWPKSATPDKVEARDLVKAPYTVNGVTYEFTCANPLEATGSNFPYFDAKNSYLYIKSYRYVGLPAIEGYKLSKVVLVNGGSENGSRYVGITTKLAKQVSNGNEGQEFATGGEPIAMSGGPDTEVEFNLSDTSENTVYWVRLSPKTGALKGATLTYSK